MAGNSFFNHGPAHSDLGVGNNDGPVVKERRHQWEELFRKSKDLREARKEKNRTFTQTDHNNYKEAESSRKRARQVSASQFAKRLMTETPAMSSGEAVRMAAVCLWGQPEFARSGTLSKKKQHNCS